MHLGLAGMVMFFGMAAYCLFFPDVYWNQHRRSKGIKVEAFEVTGMMETDRMMRGCAFLGLGGIATLVFLSELFAA